MDGPCPICSHLLSTGKHRIDVTAERGRILICPSYQEFVLDGSVLMVQLPHGQGR